MTGIWPKLTRCRVALSMAEIWSASSPCRRPIVCSLGHQLITDRRGRLQLTQARRASPISPSALKHTPAATQTAALTVSSAPMSTEDRPSSVSDLSCFCCRGRTLMNEMMRWKRYRIHRDKAITSRFLTALGSEQARTKAKPYVMRQALHIAFSRGHARQRPSKVYF